MNLMRAIVVDDGGFDVAAHAISGVLNARQVPHFVLEISEFFASVGLRVLNKSGLFEIDSVKCDEWLNRHQLYNRVVSISALSAKRVSEGHGCIVPLRLLDYAYRNVMRSGQPIIGSPGYNSPVGNLYPLPIQWQLVSAECPEFSTPTYSFVRVSEELDSKSGLLSKDPWDPYDWSSLRARSRSHPGHLLVKKPEGAPVVLALVGNERFLYPLADAEISAHSRSTLLSLAERIQRCFQASIGEALIFIKCDGLITFGSFSHHVRTSSEREDFDSVIENAVASDFGKGRLGNG
jgi:hypothetical protein